MLDEYKELCRVAANSAPGWEKLSKNDLCRAYVNSKGNDVLQNAYLSAILYRYWNLIGKYYYQSANCATPEECYGWLVDSVSCCVNLAAWENPSSSIYNDPNGPDKVINRCMKCARLTYYQFINRKKRKNDFGLLSTDELYELYGSEIPEPRDYGQDVDVGDIVIQQYIIELFQRKDYFVAFMIDCILFTNVFDITVDKQHDTVWSDFNLRKLCNEIKSLDDEYIKSFSSRYELEYEDVQKAYRYVKDVPPTNIRKKVIQAFEILKHSDFIKSIRGVNNAD